MPPGCRLGPIAIWPVSTEDSELALEGVGVALQVQEPLVGRPLADAVQRPPDGLRARGREFRPDQRVPRVHARWTPLCHRWGDRTVLPLRDVRQQSPGRPAEAGTVAFAADGV